MSEELTRYRAWCAERGYMPNDWALGEYRKARVAEDLDSDALALMATRGESTDPAGPDFFTNYQRALLEASAQRSRS